MDKNGKPYIRALRCKLCRRRFKYPSSMYHHLKDSHFSDVLYWLKRRDQEESNMPQPIENQRYLQPIRISVIKQNTTIFYTNKRNKTFSKI